MLTDTDTGTDMAMAKVPKRIDACPSMKFIAMFLHRSLSLRSSVSAVGLALAGMAAPVLAQYAQPQSQPQPEAAPGAQMNMPQSGVVLATPAAQQSNGADAGATTAQRRAWSIVPRITVGETITDNVAPASGDKRGDQITEISPGIRITSDTARTKLYFDYQLREYLYAQNSGRQRSQNSLKAFGTVEAIEKWMFIDLSGVIAQQQISPFGLQTSSDASINANRTETSNFKVSPYLRGRLAGYADYELRYNRSVAHTKSTIASDVDTSAWSGKIGGGTPLANLSWSADTDKQTVEYSNGRKSESDHVRGFLSYKLGQQFKLSGSVGQESNDYATLSKESRNTHGYGFDWYPTERTQISAFKERRFFGDGHTFSISHRTPLSAWKFIDTRDISILPNQFTSVGLGSYYDLMYSQLTSSIPDPIERADVVNNQLQSLGIPANTQVVSGFLTSRVSVQRHQELSFMLQGVRNTMAFAAIRNERQALGAAIGSDDAFAVSQTIRQRGFNVNWSHRLSGLSTLLVSASQQNSAGSGQSGLATKQRSLTTNFSTRLGPKTTATFGARRTIFESTTLPYSENALTGTLTAQF